MIDQILGSRASKQDVLLDPNYDPEQSVVGSKLIGPKNSQILTVLFPPWHGGGRVFDTLANRFARSGSAVMSYSFSDHILSPDVEQVQSSFRNIRKIVCNDLDQLIRKYGYLEVNAVAASLGNVSLAYVARVFSDFSKATMIVAGSNLAHSTWEGSRTQQIRLLMEKQGVNEEALDNAWRDLAPETNAVGFKNKPLHFIKSSTDEVIPSSYQLEMEKALISIGSKVTSQTTFLGHYMTIARFCYIGRLNW
jgi:hypothetical protein